MFYSYPTTFATKKGVSHCSSFKTLLWGSERKTQQGNTLHWFECSNQQHCCVSLSPLYIWPIWPHSLWHSYNPLTFATQILKLTCWNKIAMISLANARGTIYPLNNLNCRKYELINHFLCTMQTATAKSSECIKWGVWLQPRGGAKATCIFTSRTCPQ